MNARQITTGTEMLHKDDVSLCPLALVLGVIKSSRFKQRQGGTSCGMSYLCCENFCHLNTLRSFGHVLREQLDKFTDKTTFQATLQCC